MLGAGAFATVHRAQFRAANAESVAVKVVTLNRLAGDDIRYLQTELEVAITAPHPNVVASRDLFQSRTHVPIVLEYVRGGTLQQYVSERTRLDEKAARAIFADILHGAQPGEDRRLRPVAPATGVQHVQRDRV